MNRSQTPPNSPRLLAILLYNNMWTTGARGNVSNIPIQYNIVIWKMLLSHVWFQKASEANVQSCSHTTDGYTCGHTFPHPIASYCHNNNMRDVSRNKIANRNRCEYSVSQYCLQRFTYIMGKYIILYMHTEWDNAVLKGDFSSNEMIENLTIML